MILPILTFLGVLQQQPAARRVAPAVAERRAESFDTARAIVSAVGRSVADVRSNLELYRRAVFNSTDADVLSTADALRGTCLALNTEALSGARRMCRTCGAREVQPSLQGYRGVLPEVGRTGAQCAGELSRLLRAREAAKELRHGVFAVGNIIFRGLVPYERRLGALRVAAGWAPPRVAPVPIR